jgi:poly(A) polymerase
MTKTEHLLGRLRAAALASGQRLWLAGGFVRDGLLGRVPKRELDITVADPRALLAALRRAPGESLFALDVERGTFRLVLPAGGGLTHIDIARLRAPTIDEDLALRDFTVNAIAVDITGGDAGPLLDPTGGIADCRRGVLRACGTRSIADDPLRALRGVRFAAGLGLRIAPATLRFMSRAGQGLRRVSPERIRDELFLVLQGPRPAWGAALALRLGLLRGVGMAASGALRLARLRRVERVTAGLPPRGAPRRALAEELEQGVTRLGLLFLAALIRDLGAQRRAGRVCARLMLGNRASRVCAAAVTVAVPRTWFRAPEIAGREPLLEFYRAADPAALEIILLGAASTEQARALARRYAAARRIFERPPLLTGATAMRELGLAPGPGLGRLLAATKRAQDLGTFRTLPGAISWARSFPAPKKQHPRPRGR